MNRVFLCRAEMAQHDITTVKWGSKKWHGVVEERVDERNGLRDGLQVPTGKMGKQKMTEG